MAKHKDPEVDAFIAGAAQWQAETKQLRAILLGCGLQEALKWRKPCYAQDGSNIAIIQGFKAHCALMFFKGVLLRDPGGHLKAQGPNTQSALRLEFTDVKQIKAQKAVIEDFVAQAIAAEQAGLKADFEAKDALELPAALATRLEADPKLDAAFRALTPGRQRAYAMHIAGAKQEKTRAARVDRCAPQILRGKGLNDR